MPKIVSIKLIKVGPTAGPFTISDQWGNIIAEGVSRKDLMEGMHYMVDDGVTMIRLASTGDCTYEKIIPIANIAIPDFYQVESEIVYTGCLWRHLKNPEIYNIFYGNVEPYIIEYPFAYDYQDQILQNVKDYTRVYQYIADPLEVQPHRIETDDIWFNKAIVYNGQQCSGVLNLVHKPKHNLRSYLTYPIYRSDGKDIMFTKSDNWYQYNTFWSVVRDKAQPLFIRGCEPLSIDKEINQANMDYGTRSFRKEPLRAKDLRVRHILDDRSDAHLVSQILFTPSQISYK